MSKRKLNTVRLYDDEKERLQKLAEQFGYTIGRGLYPNRGSVRGLLLAILEGELNIAPTPEPESSS